MLARHHDGTVTTTARPVPAPTLADLRRLLETRGGERYDGEPVTHLAHALQCADLARRAGAGDTLVVAALLHDIGHLASGLPATPSADGIDDRHEAIGAALLALHLPPAVSEPVRLHVAAKRWLAARPAYLRALSDDSRRSLALQGGALDPAARAAFIAEPHAREAIRLRRWDDAAKRAGAPTTSLAAIWPLVERLAR
jgi:phosphonate degradation associated HDIG domain protein